MVQLINPLAAVNEGQQFVDGLFTQRANRQAGQALQQGNYNQAAGALFGNGDLRGGMGVQQYGQEQQAAQRSQEQEQQARQMAFSLQAIKALKGVQSQGGNVVEAYASYAPVFQQLGIPADQVQQLGQALAANPEGFLTAAEQIVGQQARQLEIQNLGNGYGVAIDKATGAVVNEYQAPQRPVNVGNVLIDPSTREVILDAREPKYQTIQNTDGSTSVVAIDQPAPIRGGAGGDGSFDSVIGPLLQREGGFVARDGSSGAPANFGINQRANPDVNVRDLTPDRATELYRERYWNPVVQAGVPPEAREAVFDFAVNAGPQRAISAWRQSGGDLNAFNQARLEHYRRQPDYAQYGRAWERRVAETSPGTVDTRGGARVVAQGENRGLSPAQQRAEATANRAERRQNQAEENSNRRDEVNLRREFNNRQEVKDFRTVQSAYNSVQAAARNPSAAGDLSLIFAYMKILDPGSVVREQEFANAQNAAGVPDRIRNLYNRALNGQRLNPNQRNDFLSQANNLFQTRQQTYRGIENEYRGYAESYGVSPDRVAPTQGGQQAGRRTRANTNTGGAVPFNLSPQQLSAWQQLGSSGGDPSAPLGSVRNPRWVNPQDPRGSYGNIRRGEYFYTPDGQRLQKR